MSTSPASPFEHASQTRYNSMQPAASTVADVSRIDSGANLRQRAARRISHDIEAQIQAQKRGSSFTASSATSLSGSPAQSALDGAMPMHKPLEHHWNWIAIALTVFNFAATGFYFYIRITGLMWAAEGLW
jgi:hypothetical protein